MAKRMKEKSEKINAARDRRPQATAKYLRISPPKVRIVLDNIRGKKVNDAMAILENATQEAAEVTAKLLKSAIANAENNKGLNRDSLIVAEVWAGPGPLLKRINIRGRGRADRILKRTSHITIILDEAK